MRLSITKPLMTYSNQSAGNKAANDSSKFRKTPAATSEHFKRLTNSERMESSSECRVNKKTRMNNNRF